MLLKRAALLLAVLALNLLGSVFARAQNQAVEVAYYVVSHEQVMFWPHGTDDPYLVATFNEGKWRFVDPQGSETPLPSGLAAYFAEGEQPQFNPAARPDKPGAADYAFKLWPPEARVYVVPEAADRRVGVLTEHFAYFDSIPADGGQQKLQSSQSIQLLARAIGPKGLAALQQSAGRPEWTTWLQSILDQRQSTAVVYKRKDGRAGWVLQQRVIPDEWQRQTAGMFDLGSAVSIISTQAISAPPPAPVSPSQPMDWPFLIGAGFVGLILGSLSLYTWDQWQLIRKGKGQATNNPKSVQPAQSPTRLLAPYESTASAKQSNAATEVMSQLVEILVTELHSSAVRELEERNGPQNADLLKPALDWAKARYLITLQRGGMNERLNAMERKLAQELFGVDGLDEAHRRVEVGKLALDALVKIKATPFQTEALARLAKSDSPLPNLASTLMQMDRMIGELQSTIETNQDKVRQAEERRSLLGSREEEIGRLKTSKASMEKQISQTQDRAGKVETERNQYKQILQRALDIGEVADMCAKGRREFVTRSGKFPEIAAVAFLIEYSLFRLTQAILAGESEDEAVMRENLRRICQKAVSQNIPGFDPAIVGSQDDGPFNVNDHERHPDRALFTGVMQVLRNFGSFLIEFDFDVDPSGVYRAA
ncbi:MAG TPA: hypothetical protein VI636_21470 [Candidatus Angelobacter sp.]